MVDKLYIMLPEFDIIKYDYRRAMKDFKGSKEIMSTLAEMFKSGSIFESISDTPIKFQEWFNENKENYRLDSPRIVKLKYDYDKPAHQQKSFRGDGGKARRNNALIDMMWGILTNPDTASKMLNPGGFDKQKMAARVVTILDSMTREELTKEGYTIADILRMSKDMRNLKTLSKLAGRAKKGLDPLSPRTQVIIHQQNMTGGKMIGIYANHNANHALMQHTQLAIDDENGAFNLGGVKRVSLHGIKNESGDFISRNNANFLAASVDNVKDNTLHATNQNTFTGNASMLLSRLGYNPTEIAILMKQPIIVEITKKFFRDSRDGKSKDAIIDEVISTTSKYAGMYENLSWANVKDNLFNFEMLMGDIQLYKEVGTMSQKDKVNFYRRQAAVGILFKRIMNTADALARVVQATRADTPNGAAGPTIADTMIKLQKVDDLLFSATFDKRFPLLNVDVIRNHIRYTGNIDEIREQLLSSPLPFLQAFYTLGLRQTERMLGSYFPHFTKPFQEVLNGKYEIVDGNIVRKFAGLREYTKNGMLNVKTINSIYNDLLVYIMSNTDFFGSGRNRHGKEVSSAEKRRDFINNFPIYFKHIVNNNEDIASLEFVQRLKTALHNDKNPVDVLVFKNVGRLSPTLRERYMRDWATLLYMENPEAQELALNLFLYSYYRNGFAFGPSTFIHLAPTAVRDAINGYIPTLRNLLTTTDSYEEFIEQYIYNHLDNRQLVPEIPDTSFTKFVDEKGNVKDEIVISINPSSTYGDKAAVKKEERDEQGNATYEFFDFIGRRINGKWYYYRQLSSYDNTDTLPGDNSAIYTRIEPLGYKNSFLEYEYGKEASEIETVINKNKKDYDPLAEFAAQHEQQELTEEMLKSIPDYSEAYSEEAMASFANEAAYEAIYDEPFPSSSIDSDTFTDIAPNTSYRDANDEEVCGGGIIVAEF